MMYQFNQFQTINPWVLIILLVWMLFWKGIALWISAREEKKWWFWIILVFNTMGLLEIIYLFAVAKKGWKDLKEVFSKPISEK